MKERRTEGEKKRRTQRKSANGRRRIHPSKVENAALRKLRWRFALINAISILAVLAVVVIGIYSITRTSIERQARSYLKQRVEQQLRILEEPEPSDEGEKNAIQEQAEPPRQGSSSSSGSPNPPPNGGSPSSENLPSNAPSVARVHEGFYTLEDIFKPISSSRQRTGTTVMLVTTEGVVTKVLSGEPISEENEITRIQLAITAAEKGAGYMQISLDGDSYVLYLMSYQYHGADCYILAYQGSNNDFAALNSLLRTCLSMSIPVFLVVLLISYFLASRAMAPMETTWRKQQEFVADAAHELRTPIAVIRSNTDALALHPNKTIASQQKWLNYIREDTHRMEDLVNELLYLANADSGQQNINVFPNDISALLREAVMSCEPLFYEKGLEVESKIAPDLYVSCEPTMMKKIFSIFLDNMQRHAALPGKGSVCARQQSGKVLATFTNDAAPMDEESLDHLFDRFYRNDRSRQHSESSGGYGLGLSIAQRLVSDTGGRITVKQDGGQIAFTLSWAASA